LNNDKLTDHERFEAVWSRVMEENAVHSALKRNENDASVLRMLMDDAHCAAGAYSALRRRVSGRAAEMLGEILADERRHLRSLKTAYFLKTGRTYSPPASCPAITSVTGALRMQYDREGEMSAKYIACASQTGDMALSGLYRSISSDEVHHARTIMRLCEKLVGNK